MKKDFVIALVLVGAFVVVVGTNHKFPAVLEVFMNMTRPVATIVFLLGVGALYYHDYKASALMAAVLSAYILKTLWVSWPSDDARRLHLETGRDQARFEPSNSIDLQFANGSVKHEMPHLLHPPPGFPEMLVFPPTIS